MNSANLVVMLQESNLLRGWVCMTTVIVGCLGCQPGWQAATYPVSGSITINGEPPVGAVVTLIPTGDKVDERNSKPWAVVDEQGQFTLQTYLKEDGAPAGDYIVTVKWPWDVKDMSQAMSDRLGGAYAFPDKSDIRVTIARAPTVLAPIEIVKAKVANKPGSDRRNNAAGPPGPSTPK
ncbi:MAG: hypothetical protein KDB22_08610 [Planctomycetales bacterium]|nr:hypothetical protein [Planctomycetales bacterium]